MATVVPMDALHQYIEGLNNNDGAAMAAAFAVPGSILDGMAPHLWQDRSLSGLDRGSV